MQFRSVGADANEGHKLTCGHEALAPMDLVGYDSCKYGACVSAGRLRR